MNERILSKVLVIPTALVVLVLAVLLYRWSNQISEATSVRLADSLQMSMANWHLNLYRDLSDVAGALRVDSENSSDLPLYARRFKEWRSASRYREVAAGLFVLKNADGEKPLALHLDEESGQFTTVDWPASLLSLRQELKRAPQKARNAGGSFFPRGLAGWSFDPATPAIVRPIESLNSWLVVELDRKTIQSRILPDLAKRYFMGVDSLDYMIAVVSGPQNREVIYSSDTGFADQEVPDADGRMDVFGRVTERSLGAPLYVFHKLSENSRISDMAASIGTSWFPLLDESKDEDGWQLIVRHRRGGALGAFVAELHRRDLAISFGVLFLLVVSVALLIVTSLRANRLAKLQMDFVTAVSHELRSPLTIIGSAAENITQGVVGSREQIEQYGRVIESQTRQLSRLVEEVLLFAATRDDRHRYNSRPLEVSEVVGSALASAADLIEAAKFTVERDVPSSLPQVCGDLAALSQCLQNLITNALKYGGGQRWIGIRAGVHENAGTRSKEVQISVADRGMGIEARDLPHIFEPFYRSSSVTAAQIHGTGLGLALAMSIAEAMQGQLTVISQPGKGTTFTLHLPILAAPTPTGDPVRLPSPG